MAEKKVPQEPCLLHGKNPCDECGRPLSRKRELKKREEERDDPAEAPRTAG